LRLVGVGCARAQLQRRLPRSQFVEDLLAGTPWPAPQDDTAGGEQIERDERRRPLLPELGEPDSARAEPLDQQVEVEARAVPKSDFSVDDRTQRDLVAGGRGDLRKVRVNSAPRRLQSRTPAAPRVITRRKPSNFSR
jgi:hypothetical protein